MARQNALVVAAIDFGTTYSGIAFQFRHEYDRRDPTKIQSPQVWNGGSRKLISNKTPTCLLLNDKQEVDSFGYEAEERYADLCLNGEQKHYYFFRRFKMMLQEGEGLKKDSTIEDETGKPLQALKVFSLSIQCLKQKLVEILRGTNDTKSDVKDEDILWVLTVPAIWDDSAKEFMKEAAKQAGIKEEHLSIALEPEAASLLCQFLPVEKLCDEQRNAFSRAQPGTVYMVADLGGGTADITIHERLAHNQIREIYKASGGPWGATAVDHAFTQLFVSIVGGPVMSRFRKEHTIDHLDLMQNIEVVKRSVGEKKADEWFIIKVPVTLDELCKAEHEETLKSLVDQSPQKDKIAFVGDKMRLDASLVEGMFKGVTDEIVGHVRTILKNTDQGKKVALVLMVGGFSESPFVRREMRAGVPSNIKVLVPQQASLAVLNGAVVFGRMPESIQGRVLRYTYGLKVERPFQPEFDPIDKKNPDNGMCRDVFRPFVMEGTQVQHGQHIINSIKTTEPFQKNMTISVYVAKGKIPEYVTDKNCRLFGALKVDVAKPTQQSQEFQLVFRFGSTTLSMIAVDKETKKVMFSAFKLNE